MCEECGRSYKYQTSLKCHAYTHMKVGRVHTHMKVIHLYARTTRTQTHACVFKAGADVNFEIAERIFFAQET